jgi:hypothetical protein
MYSIPATSYQPAPRLHTLSLPYIKKQSTTNQARQPASKQTSQPIPLPLCPKPTRNKGNDMIKRSNQGKRGTRVNKTKSPKKKTAKIFKGTFREMFMQSSKKIFLIE